MFRSTHHLSTALRGLIPNSPQQAFLRFYQMFFFFFFFLNLITSFVYVQVDLRRRSSTNSPYLRQVTVAANEDGRRFAYKPYS